VVGKVCVGGDGGEEGEWWGWRRVEERANTVEEGVDELCEDLREAFSHCSVVHSRRVH
jgi:hypothetical protein